MKVSITTLLLILSSITHGQSDENRNFLFFEPNVADINNSHIQFLEELYQSKIFEKSLTIISIIGHADSIGDEQLNLKLSERRANSVYNFLRSKNVPESLMRLNSIGEKNQLFIKQNSASQSKNRCVEIILEYKNPDENSKGSLESNVQSVKFENDTILYFSAGTRIEISAKTFYPIRIKDIDIEVKEIFSLCDMLKNGATTIASDGSCLTSAGMLYIKASYDGTEIQPNKEQFVRIKIPTIEGKLDKSMKIYGQIRNIKGDLVWEKLKSELSYEEDGSRYYLFDTDSIFNLNLDKPIGVICEKNGPKLKVPKLRDTYITQIYPNEFYLSVAERRTNRKFVLDELQYEKEPYIIIIGKDKFDSPFIAEGNLKDLKFRKISNKYIVKKKYFKSVIKDFTGKNGSEDIMCEYFEAKTNLAAK